MGPCNSPLVPTSNLHKSHQNRTALSQISYPFGPFRSSISSFRNPSVPDRQTRNAASSMEKTGQKAADHYVEVCSNEDGFLGSYFLARVIGSVAGGEKLRVEYATLLDDSGKAPLKEVVRASHVRPLPPQVRVSRFDVLDEVDAYDLDGWWAGRVTARKDDFNYVVYFDSSGDEFDYPASDLRVHLEFDNGRWVSSVKGFDMYKE
ncbi:protein AGENET DOMAIN (AGD)-CONTAINING P1-like [Diospyros lotus]|uniref:protein AGENET DOMAIN (AGD)-CONTAINING P1-like n=1 Tax=Diospyros lotus TaxID=55363 RepID=UPI002253552B|nr:protein AGENET DOMAIN (AGD)-CONTAINING P1-like [Diospyros lotus]